MLTARLRKHQRLLGGIALVGFAAMVVVPSVVYLLFVKDTPRVDIVQELMPRSDNPQRLVSGNPGLISGGISNIVLYSRTDLSQSEVDAILVLVSDENWVPRPHDMGMITRLCRERGDVFESHILRFVCEHDGTLGGVARARFRDILVEMDPMYAELKDVASDEVNCERLNLIYSRYTPRPGKQ